MCAHVVFTVISRSLLIYDPNITNKQINFFWCETGIAQISHFGFLRILVEEHLTIS